MKYGFGILSSCRSPTAHAPSECSIIGIDTDNTLTPLPVGIRLFYLFRTGVATDRGLVDFDCNLLNFSNLDVGWIILHNRLISFGCPVAKFPYLNAHKILKSTSVCVG